MRGDSHASAGPAAPVTATVRSAARTRVSERGPVRSREKDNSLAGFADLTVDDDALIEAAAAEAARAIETLDLAPWAGLMLLPQEPIYALVWGMPADAAPDYELDSDTMGELGNVP